MIQIAKENRSLYALKRYALCETVITVSETEMESLT